MGAAVLAARRAAEAVRGAEATPVLVRFRAARINSAVHAPHRSVFGGRIDDSVDVGFLLVRGAPQVELVRDGLHLRLCRRPDGFRPLVERRVVVVVGLVGARRVEASAGNGAAATLVLVPDDRWRRRRRRGDGGHWAQDRDESTCEGKNGPHLRCEDVERRAKGPSATLRGVNR